MELASRRTSGVEPPYVILPTLTALPKRCIATNQPVGDDDYRTFNIPCVTYRAIWLTVLIIGPMYLLFTPFARTRCKLKAGISPAARRKYLLIRWILILSPILALTAAIVSASESMLAVFAFTLVIFYFGLPVVVLTWHPLRARKRHGDLYWVRGFCDEYLKQLDSEQQAAALLG